MRVCSVYVMGFYNRDEHVRVAGKVIEEFQKTSTKPDEAYKAKLYLVDEETEEAVRFALERTDRPRPDYVVSIGTDLTIILKKLYTEITPIPTICVLPDDPIGNGIIESFKRPGGWISGVCIGNIDEQQEFSYTGSQDIFKWMLPYFTKILIPYDVQLPNITEAEVLGVAGELAKIGFEPLVKKVSGDEEAARYVYNNVGQVHAVASFAVSENAERNISYWCGIAEPKRLLISSNGDRGLLNGAAVAVGPKNDFIIYQHVVTMVRNGWYERVWPGVQPFTILPAADHIKKWLKVNSFMLPPLPKHIMEAMRNTPDATIQHFWPYYPMYYDALRKQQELERDENDDKKKE